MKPIVWLHGEIKTPPMSRVARVEAGYLLRLLQLGELLAMPKSRPMPDIGRHCHELRIRDGRQTWRIIYRIDNDAIVIVEIFQKQTVSTPQFVIDNSKTRLKRYDAE